MRKAQTEVRMVIDLNKFVILMSWLNWELIRVQSCFFTLWESAKDSRQVLRDPLFWYTILRCGNGKDEGHCSIGRLYTLPAFIMLLRCTAECLSGGTALNWEISPNRKPLQDLTMRLFANDVTVSQFINPIFKRPWHHATRPYFQTLIDYLRKYIRLYSGMHSKIEHLASWGKTP